MIYDNARVTHMGIRLALQFKIGLLIPKMIPICLIPNLDENAPEAVKAEYSTESVSLGLTTRCYSQ
jgi:hypothetical protein